MHTARSDTRDDTDRLKRAMAKIKSENRKLRKELSKLKKALSKVDRLNLEREIDLEEEADEPEIVRSNKTNGCPKCSADALMIIDLGKYKVTHCSVCGFRKRQETKS